VSLRGFDALAALGSTQAIGFRIEYGVQPCLSPCGPLVLACSPVDAFAYLVACCVMRLNQTST